jgi:molybdate transport system regulatory protein
MDKTQPHLHLTLNLANGARLAPEDVELIETIGRVRSILGTAKVMDLSYRKTWLMVDALNRAFETPVIETHPGRRGAGANPSAFGLRVVALYRSALRQATRASQPVLAELNASLDPTFQLMPKATAAAGEDPQA